MQAQQRLDLADDFTAGGFGFEHLPDKAFESQAQAEDAVAAVGADLFGGEQRRGQKIAQMVLELGQGGLADGGGGAAQGGQAAAQAREVGGVPSKYIYLLG